MFIKFQDSKTKMLCNSQIQLCRFFGERAAANVQRMLFMLDAAPNLRDISDAPPMSLRYREEEGVHYYSIGGEQKCWPKVSFRPDSSAKPLDQVVGVEIFRVNGEKS